MIRKDRAEFLDNVLKLFEGKRTIRKKELEIKYKDDSYIFYQTEKHLKILEADGMINDNGFDEYHLQSKGLRILNDIESLGYLARHKVAAVEAEKQEEKGHDVPLIIDLFLWLLFFLNLAGCIK